MKKIAFRVDGGRDIGMGHVMRCMSLADGLANENEITFICNDALENELGRNFISKKYQIKMLRQDSILSDMRKISADILITDSYSVDEEYFSQVGKIFKCTGYIDDMNLYDFSDLKFVINQNYASEKLEYKGSSDTIFMLGSDYLMCREEFQNVKKINIKKHVNKIGILMGGSDVLGLTPRIIEYIKLINSDFEIDAVVTTAYPDYHSLNKIYELSNKVNILVSPKISEFLSDIDILVSAGGSSLYEACIIGVPTIGIRVADNQTYLCENMYSDGLIEYLSSQEELSLDKFKGILVDILNCDRRIKMQKQQSLIKGNGISNIKRNFKQNKFI